MLIEDIRVSLLRFCANFAEQFPDTEQLYFDAHADENSLPDKDLVGLSGLSVKVDDHFVEIRCLLGVATLDDTNLFKLSEKIGKLFELLLPTKKIPVYDAQTGIEKGWMILDNGTMTLPISGSNARPLQYISISLLSSLTFNLG